MEDMLPTILGSYIGNIVIRGYNPMNSAFYTNLGVQLSYGLFLEDTVMKYASNFKFTENVELENAVLQAVATGALLYGVRTFTGDNTGIFPIAVEAGMPALTEIAYEKFMSSNGMLSKKTVVNAEHSMASGKVKA